MADKSIKYRVLSNIWNGETALRLTRIYKNGNSLRDARPSQLTITAKVIQNCFTNTLLKTIESKLSRKSFPNRVNAFDPVSELFKVVVGS